MKIKLRFNSEESRERWKLIKEASKEVSNWDELKKAEAYRRTKTSEQTQGDYIETQSKDEHIL